MHTCPLHSPGPVPHLGGPVISGATSVLIGFQPAARLGDQAACTAALDTIAAGEPTVLIEGQQAARMGDPTAHGGILSSGCPTVLIGASAQAATLQAAAVDGTPFCQECGKAGHRAEGESG